MVDIIVQTPENVTLVGAGQASKAQLHAALDHAPYLVAADGGAEMLLNYGKTPKKVIGDFDSINSSTLAKIPVADQYPVREQDSTDFEKCLTRLRAPLIIGVGFLGRRLDHQLAVFNALVRHRASPCVLIGEDDVVFHAGSTLNIALEPGSRLSLFPLAPVRGRSRGLKWPIDGLDFAPNGRIGTSNQVTGPSVQLNFVSPGMLVILPRTALAAVVQALTASGGGA